MADDPITVSESETPGIVIVTPVASDDPQFITINEGTAGPQGAQGPPGPPGPGGGSGLDIADVAYVHNQSTPSATWTIIHPLAYSPTVTVVDSAGSEQIGTVRYAAQNTIIVSFGSAFSGTAFLS